MVSSIRISVTSEGGYSQPHQVRLCGAVYVLNWHPLGHVTFHPDEIYQSRVTSASALNYVSSTPEEWSVLAFRAPPASRTRSQHSPTPGPCHCLSQTTSSAGIIGITPTRPRSVVLCVPGRETNGLAGGCVVPTCWFSKLFSGLSSR